MSREEADSEPMSCATAMVRAGLLAAPLPALGDPEGERVPDALPPVVDAHVHLFPDAVFDALWRWFERHGWPIRYPLRSPAIVEFLLDRGVDHLVALHYAHKPGMARALNAFVAELARHPKVTGLATVLPGEPGAPAILQEAFALGLSGVKLHCHVQCFSPDDDAMHALYEVCARAGKPMVIHAGREPKSPAYACDPHVLCAAERVDRALSDHPGLTLVVPHLGADELPAYERLLERHEGLWLDSTMMAADYFPLADDPMALIRRHPERVLYGTDFPNLPYAWDRELRRILALDLPEAALAALLGGNARSVFRLPAC